MRQRRRALETPVPLIYVRVKYICTHLVPADCQPPLPPPLTRTHVILQFSSRLIVNLVVSSTQPAGPFSCLLPADKEAQSNPKAGKQTLVGTAVGQAVGHRVLTELKSVRWDAPRTPSLVE